MCQRIKIRQKPEPTQEDLDRMRLQDEVLSDFEADRPYRFKKQVKKNYYERAQYR